MSYVQVGVKPKRPKRPKYVDPFAPLTEAQLRKRAQEQASQQTAPLLAQLQAAINNRSASGVRDITGYTGSLQQALQGLAPRVQAAYGAATQSQAATNDALAQRLSGQGQQLSSELAGKLGQINAPASAQTQVAGGAATAATGAANAGYATGSAELSRLLAQGANANEYTAKLPGIAGLEGQQQVRNLQGSLSQQLAEQSGQITAQGQSIAAQVYEHLVDQELQKALAKSSGLSRQAQLDYKRQNDAYNRRIKQQNADTSSFRATSTASHQSATEKQAAKNERDRNRRAAAARRDQNRRQTHWATKPDGTLRYRWNKKTHRKERIPLSGKKGSSVNSTTGVPNY